MQNSQEIPATSGTTKQLVIILHGWGADGANLIDIARPWSMVMPDAHFWAPNAPHVCEANPFGFQWFSLADRSPAVMQAGVADAAQHVNAMIDEKLAETGASQLALVGFSQGTMTALHIGLRRADVLCVLGYSGALLDSQEMIEGILDKGEASRPNGSSTAEGEPGDIKICLIHGEDDDIVPFAAMAHAQAVLKSCNINITTHPRPNLPHSIDMEGVEIGGRFLVEVLGDTD